MSDKWHCEECGEKQNSAPASKETYDGVEGDVELWFCSECTRYER
jgi:hypothetical protein